MSILRKPAAFFVIFTVCVIPLAPLAAQTPPDESLVIIPKGETVKIGVATDLSNLLPAPGLDVAQSAELAVLDFTEEHGGIHGFEIELVIEDDLCTAEGALAVAEEFAERGDILAVVGHLCSGASIPASEIYYEARIPMISPASTAGAFTARGLDVVNRTVFNDNVQGVVAARFIHTVLKAEQVAVLHNKTPYGEGLAQTVADTLDELNVEVVMFEGIDSDADDFTDTLATIGDEVDLIYLGGYEQEGARFVEQMRESGMTDVVFFSGDGVYTPDFLKFAAEFSEGVYATFGRQVGDLEATEAFKARYTDFFGIAPEELGPYHTQAYDAATIILNAIQVVAEVNEAGDLVVDREALIDAIHFTRGYQGLSGRITCDVNGDCVTAVIDVYRVEDGAWVQQEVPEALQVSQE